MTVIVDCLWGKRVTQVVDRQISRGTNPVVVVDRLSTKVCVLLCSDALVSVSFTGVAVVGGIWMDTVIASCIAHRPLDPAMIQLGAAALARPLHIIIDELALNLNARLNTDSRARGENLQISIVGWHIGPGLKPRELAWELIRRPVEPNGMRYFLLKRKPVGKFLRQYPTGLWAEPYGDFGITVQSGLEALANTDGYTHERVEQHIHTAIQARANETEVVGPSCIAVQLNPFDSSGQVQFTHYPSGQSREGSEFIAGWVLTPRMICSPSLASTFGSTYSACGQYLEGGYQDAGTNLHVRLRLPVADAGFGGPQVLHYGTQARAKTV